MSRTRTILAFLIAPLAIPIGSALLSAVFPGDSRVSFPDFFGLIALYSFFALPPAYLCEVLFGIPAWLLFRRHGFRSWSMFAAGGIILGTTYFLAFTIVAAAAKARGYDIYEHSCTRYWFNPMAALFDVPAGLVCALLFRAIVFPWCSHNPKPATA